MSLKVNVQQLRKDLPELLERVVQENDHCLIERNGQPYAVLVSLNEWRKQTAGKRLDGLGRGYRVSRTAQARTEKLLAKQKTTRLTPAEQLELSELLQASESVMLKRAEALNRI